MNIKKSFGYFILTSLGISIPMHAMELFTVKPQINIIDPDTAGLVGKKFTEGMLEAIKKNVDPGNVIESVMTRAGRGVERGAKEFSKEIGKSLMHFGSGSEHSKKLSDVMRTQGADIASFFDGVGTVLFPFMAKQALVMAGGIVATATAYYGTRTFWNYVQDRLINPPPKIIIESSKQAGMFGRLKNWMFGGPQLPKMIFAPALEQRLDNLVNATRNTNARIKAGRTNIKYRNVALYGPPGTGKTMFAMRWAKQSGMDFVRVSASAFFQPGAGIKAIDELFSWANKKKGLFIFIDEADSLFSSREDMKVDSETYRLITHILNYLDKRSSEFKVVAGTNRLKVFDEALQRRFDDVVPMPLPEQTERFRTLIHYRDTILRDVKQNGKAFVDSVDECLTDQKVNAVAGQTKGFSYGDLSGIINTLLSDASCTDDGLIDDALIDVAVNNAIEKKHVFTQIAAPTSGAAQTVMP